MQAVAADQQLPPLRDDLKLFRGARDWGGRPNWTVFDPLRNRYFQFDERQFMLLTSWSLGTPEQIRQSLAEHGLDVDFSEISELFEFLLTSQLLDVSGPALRQRLSSLQQAGEKSLFQKVLHGYLFVRIPLVRPDRFLDWLYPKVRLLYTRTFLRITVAVGVIALFLVMQRWQEFATSFPWFFSFEGMIVLGVTLVAVKVIHELGHALTCKHYGLRVPTMGIAFLVMWPVLYTDASDAWQLSRRRQRAFIDAAGVSVELVMACYAMLLWVILPDGLAKSAAMAVATTTWILSVLVNLNPFMRFDGYYFLSDLLNVPNLQERSFALARWKLRTVIFGLDMPAPEHLPRPLHRGLIAFGFGVWIYRFFLFLGIALLVYHFFFKALGVFLFVVEIWWFILRPIFSEMTHWRELANAMKARRKALLAGLGLLLLAFLVYPWKQNVVVPAEWSRSELTRVYTPEGARVAAVRVRSGQAVSRGDVLVELSSPSLEHELKLARLEVSRINGAISENAASGEERFSERLVLQQQLEQALSELDALVTQHNRLTVTSPNNGEVRDLNPELHEGRWIGDKKHLLTVVGSGGSNVTAWVRENDVSGLDPGSKAAFYADNGFGPMGAPVEVVKVSTSSLARLTNPYHASTYGGDIPVRTDRERDMIPEVALYRVELVPEMTPEFQEPSVRLRGWVNLETERRSYLGTFSRWVMAVLIRESAF